MNQDAVSSTLLLVESNYEQKTKSILHPNEQRSLNLSVFEQTVNKQIGPAISRIKKLYDLSNDDLSARIAGVTSRKWSDYQQPGYSRPKHLHVLAAFSWMVQTSMSVYYHGRNVEKNWAGVDSIIIETFMHTGRLSHSVFRHFIELVIDALEIDVDLSTHTRELDELRHYKFLMPERLDIDAFGQDYYQSVGREFSAFRKTYGLNFDDMANGLGCTVEKYKKYEEGTALMPFTIGLRLKHGFKYNHTSDFTRHMTRYPGFSISRRIQDTREAVIIKIMSKLSKSDRENIKVLARASLSLR